MSDFIKQLAKAQVFSNTSNRFTAGKGILIVKDVKIFKASKPGGDPFTEAAEFQVKKSQATVDGISPNLPGTTVSSIFTLSQGKNIGSQQSSAQKLHFAILGPSAATITPEQLGEALTSLLRPFPDGNVLAGRTDPAKPCPARGLQVAYETYKGKDGKYYPNFFAVDTSEAELAENLKLLAGAETEG